MTASPAQIDRAVSLFEEAAAANDACVFRQGNTIALDHDAGHDVLISTDLHGNRLHYERLLQIADLDGQPERHIVMQEVCHGGPSYPNSSACMSHLLLEDVAANKIAFPDRFHFLLSNHELAEITDFPISKQGRVLNLAFRFGVQTFYGEGAEQVRQAMSRFIRSCPIGIRIAKRILVTHSLPEAIAEYGFDATIFDRPLEEEDWQPNRDLFRLVWGRDFSEENARQFCEIMHADLLIHGHEHCPSGYSTPNPHQIIIDSCGDVGCYVILELQAASSQTQIIPRITRITEPTTSDQ